jgi:hypothetical protein
MYDNAQTGPCVVVKLRQNVLNNKHFYIYLINRKGLSL